MRQACSSGGEFPFLRCLLAHPRTESYGPPDFALGKKGAAHFIDLGWPPGQAFAVVELLVDQHERIWSHLRVKNRYPRRQSATPASYEKFPPTTPRVRHGVASLPQRSSTGTSRDTDGHDN